MQRSMMHCGWLKTCKEHRALCRRFWRSCLPTQPIPLWELLSFSEAAKAVDPAIKMPAVPTPSQPRQGSTAPTLVLRRGTNPTHTTDPLWELSSFSEAAKAVGQAIKMPAVPPPSQPRWGSTAPTLELRRGTNCTHTADPLWELSSFSEAAKAVDQSIKMPAVPPPSQPRQGSTAPTLDLRRRQHCANTTNPLWELSSFSEAAKAVGQAIKMPAVPPPSQPRWGSTAPTLDLRRRPNSANTTDPLWELSSFSEAAKAVDQSIKMPAVPPPSQPRWGSTAPTLDLRRRQDCANTADPLVGAVEL